MNKILKKILLAAAIAVGTVGLVWGILTLVRSASREAVNVYAVSDFMTTDSWSSVSQSSGSVTTDKLQKVHLSSTQTVTEICVEEGQAVRKGDKLLSYDTTLSELDVQMAQIQLEREELSLRGLKADLQLLQEEKDSDTLEREKAILTYKLEKAQEAARKEAGQSTSAPVPTVPDVTEQDGTQAKPLYRKGTSIDPANITPKNSEVDCYVVLYTEVDGIAESYQGIILKPDGSIGFFTPDPIPTPEDTASADAQVKKLQEELSDLEELLAESHTKLELLEMQQDLREQIGQAEVELKLATLEVQKKQSEVEDGAVYSTIDGTVKIVRDENEAFQNNEAVVEISGGGGYYVSGVISELDLANVHIGDTVQINSWMSGVTCEGEIVELNDYPANETGWGGGNTNVSYYPFKAFVGEDADLQENDYVDITYQNSENRNCWYLDNMFIRTENGKSYVYIRGENGTLDQRWITTGSSLWGSYTEIRSGLTQDDYIAFPYGKDVMSGAKTQESTPDQLYGW